MVLVQRFCMALIFLAVSKELHCSAAVSRSILVNKTGSQLPYLHLWLYGLHIPCTKVTSERDWLSLPDQVILAIGLLPLLWKCSLVALTCNSNILTFPMHFIVLSTSLFPRISCVLIIKSFFFQALNKPGY